MFILAGSPIAASAQKTVKSITFKELEQFLNKQGDTAYVVNFWATWCKPCVQEMPFFEEAGKIYKEKNVRILMVSLDFEEDKKKKLLPFIKNRNIENEVVLLKDTDYNSWIGKVDKSWEGNIPVTLIYNPAKNYRVFWPNALHLNELKQLIDKAL
jgi:thiol-disulfide isomerase/thioredoxin